MSEILSLPDILVEITFLPTEAGGRRSAVRRGYRGQFFYDGLDFDAQYEFTGNESIEPGDSTEANIWFWNPPLHDGRLSVGKEFEVREGARVVARGRVKKILHLGDNARNYKQRSGDANAD